MRDLCCRSRCSNQLCAIRPCSERRGQSAVAQAEDRKKNGHNGSRTGYDDAGHDAHLPVGVALGHAIGPAPDFYDPPDEAEYEYDSEEEREYAEMWAKLLEYPAPKFRRAAIDIEVYSPLSTRMPDAREGACPVIACYIYSSDGEKRVLVLKREGMREGNVHLASDIEVEYCETEEELLR